MSGEGGGSGRETGMWDVAMYIVQRFPIIAISALLVAGGLYGANFVLSEKNQAETELLLARQQIEVERTNARRSLDEQRERAAITLAEATEKANAAINRAETAEADALKDVQDTLLTASERIQDLVLGQLKSMEDLENLRDLTAIEMQNALVDLERRRNETQTALDKAERSIRVARLTFAVDALKDTIESNLFMVDDAIDRVTESFDVNDPVALSEMTSLISQYRDPMLRGSLEYALARMTNDPIWAQKFAATLRDGSKSFEESWFNSIFGCCDKFNEPLWSELFPVVAQLVTDENLPVHARASLLQFFGNGPLDFEQPLFSTGSYADRQDAWEVLSFITEIGRGEHPQLASYQRARVPDHLADFDLAAAHVWAEWLIAEGRLPEDDQETVEDSLEYWMDFYPAFENQASPVLVAFWTNSDLASTRAQYAELEISADYTD